jgi:hypothetical protein
MTHSKWLYIFFLVSAFVFNSIPAFAQLPTGTIQGAAIDSSGASIPDATVTIQNEGTGQTRTVKAESDGSYRVPALPVGDYSVKVEKEGFVPETRQHLTLDVTQTIVLNFTLRVGSSSQQVVVTGEAPVVNTTTSTLGGLVNSDKIEDLPLNGRNYIDLSLMQSGVAKHSAQGNAYGESGTFFKSNGSTDRSNFISMDGANLVTFEGGSSGSLGGTTLGTDGIQEYRVITEAFGAEYGMSMGSQMVIVSKSGTNQFHGDAFDFLRNSALDAANYFDHPNSSNHFERLPQFRRNNFGGAFGGPIKKDKTFFYGVYEGLRQSLGVSLSDQVLGANCYSGGKLILVNNPCAVNSLNPSGNIPASMVQLAELYPAPNVPGTNIYSTGSQNPLSDNFYQLRVDQNFSATDSFFARYTTDRSSQTAVNWNNCGAGCGFPQFLESLKGANMFATVAENHIFSPALLMTTRLSFSRTQDQIGGAWPGGVASVTGPGLSLVPGQPVGIINIGGLSATGSAGGLYHLQNVYTFSDDLFYTKGRNGFKFGTLINRFNQALTAAKSLGNLNFPDGSDFLSGLPRFYHGTTGGLTGDYIFNTFGFYIQDDFRATKRLTLNMGLRYEFRTTLNEKRGYQYALRNPLVDTGSTRGPINRDPSYYNFGPRLGFAWDIFGDGKSALRGAAGIYYDLANYGQVIARDEEGLQPANAQLQHNNNGTTPSELTLPLTYLPQDIGTSVHTAQYAAGQPRNFQTNLTFERQLPGNMGLSLSYVYTRGASLFSTIDANPVRPSSIVNGVEYWLAPNMPGCENTIPSCRVNPAFQTINEAATTGTSWYNSLQVNVIKRLTNGLEFQAAYTYAKDMDTGDGISYANDCIAPGADVGLDYILANNRGPACDDVRHNLRFNLLYHLPNVKSGNWLLQKVANGWWVGNIVSVESGYPFSPLVANQRSNSGLWAGDQGEWTNYGTQTITVPNLVNPDNGAIQSNTFVPFNKNTVILGNPKEWFNVNMFVLGAVGQLGNAKRDILRGPGLGTWDFSLVKDTPVRGLGEKGMVEFRAEFFNILNRANFDVPLNGYIYSGPITETSPYAEMPDPNAAAITDTVTTSRQIQFALKVIF